MAMNIRQYHIATLEDLALLQTGLSESSICQLSITAAPPMIFYIDGATIYMGITKVYEVLVEFINSLRISSESVAWLQKRADKDGNLRKSDQIIINMVYLEE